MRKIISIDAHIYADELISEMLYINNAVELDEDFTASAFAFKSQSEIKKIDSNVEFINCRNSSASRNALEVVAHSLGERVLFNGSEVFEHDGNFWLAVSDEQAVMFEVISHALANINYTHCVTTLSRRAYDLVKAHNVIGDYTSILRFACYMLHHSS